MNAGDIVHLNWSPQSGKEMAFPHYGIVLSSSRFNELIPMVVVAPVTSKKRKQFGFLRVPVTAQTGNVSGFICIDQVRSIDPKSRGLNPSGHAVSSSCLNQCRSVIQDILF